VLFQRGLNTNNKKQRSHTKERSNNWSYILPVNTVFEANWRLNAEGELELEYALRGKAWKVYWYLLRKGKPVSVREVQRALHFSSPSVANHHLEQLRELGLVEKQEVGGHYVLVSQVKIGVVRHYVKLGRLLFPRFFFYAVFSTIFYVAYLALFLASFSRENLFIISFGAIVCTIFWYEAYRIWTLRPF
jgi:DNA-binding transcriptional ArsR family regulator